VCVCLFVCLFVCVCVWSRVLLTARVEGGGKKRAKNQQKIRKKRDKNNACFSPRACVYEFFLALCHYFRVVKCVLALACLFSLHLFLCLVRAGAADSRYRVTYRIFIYI